MPETRLYGVAELAAATGQRRATVSQWARRGRLPEPTARLAMGPVWAGPEIEGWIAAHSLTSALSDQRHGVAEALGHLGFAEEVIAQVVDELLAALAEPAGRQINSMGQWCVNRATEIRNELTASRTPRATTDDQEDRCPHNLSWLACPECVAAGEALKRQGLRAFLTAFDP
jgi:predicted DNA-binding transcriptional regulator AlpA